MKLNAIVNDVNSWTQGPKSPGAKLRMLIAELRDELESDGEVFEAIYPIFDLLYALKGGESAAVLES